MSIKLSAFKLCFSRFLIIRGFSSQIVKTNEDFNKIEERKDLKLLVKNNENQKDMTKREEQMLAQIIRSPVQMDFFWEMNQKEKPFVQKKKFFDAKGGISADTLAALHHKYDFSYQGFKRRVQFYIGLREEYNQRYIPKRHTILGPELATAHFVVYRGGFVRFKHAPNHWITDCKQMPNVYDQRFRLISVNASGLKLRWEALDNFTLLDSLEELNLSKNKLLDDFVCDKMGRLFRNSKNLSILDLSDNPLITHRGIETLHRIRSLKKLIISGTKAANYPFIDLLIILFNDVNPKCQIIV